ncbi:LysE family translocator [Alphaproteobacteria bacterium LSUCC0684]
MALDIWLAFTAATLLVLIVPGPTILLVLSYALSRGPKVAFRMVAGVALGDFIAMTVSLAGLGAVLAASATLFLVMKWVGAIYLGVMGLRLLLNARNASVKLQSEETSSSPALNGAVRDAAIVTALNPKSIGFFVAFVPQFLDQSSPVLPQFVVMIATFVSLGALNAGLYALLAGHVRSRFTGGTALRFLHGLGGGVLLGLAAVAAFRRV